MKREISFDFCTFDKKVREKSVDVLSNIKLLDDMIEGLMTVGVSALDFDILTEDNLEQYRYAHVENHDCVQLVRRIKLLPSTKLDECNILF
jgi:hypothetical protein